MPDLPWLRLYTDTVDNEKIRLLAFEDRWHYIALLCIKQQGILETESKLLERKIAIKLGLQISDLGEVKRRLIDVDLIDNDWNPKGWENKQFKSDSSTDRVRKYRENKKKKACNGNETLLKRKCNAVDTDTDTDTDTDNNKNIRESSTEISPAKGPKIPYQKIVNLWHEILPSLTKIEKLTETRRRYIKRLWVEDELPDLKNWKNFFIYIGRSDFLMGRTQPQGDRKPFKANLEWVTKPANYLKIVEKNYHG